MFDSLRKQLASKNKKKKMRKLTKQDLVIGTTLGFVMVLGGVVSSYETGIIHYDHKPPSEKKAVFGEYSKQAGPVQEIASDKPMKPQRSVKKQLSPSMPKLPTLPSFDGSALPTSMPNLSSKPVMKPTPEKRFDNTMVYAKHASITEGMKSILNHGFELVRMSDAPTGREDRFNTSFEYSLNGNALEKFELMSIAKTPDMGNIKNANEALKALIEESGAVNIIEDNGDYLIYDFAGSGGYQIGKITVSEQGIYILGYINLTTNDMPVVLKDYWINKLKAL